MLKAGERLKEERLLKGITLEQASSATKIKQSFLSSIEKSEYEELPSAAYAQGFVRNYAKYLGLAEKEVLALFRREFDSVKSYRVLPQGFSRQEEFPIRRFKIRNTFALAFLISIALGIYILFQYRSAFLGPALSISSPKDNATVNTSEVLVKGNTSIDSTVFVNEQPVNVSDSGSFVKGINVFPGDNKITIRSVNRFGKETVIIREVKSQ